MRKRNKRRVSDSYLNQRSKAQKQQLERKILRNAEFSSDFSVCGLLLLCPATSASVLVCLLIYFYFLIELIIFLKWVCLLIML